MFIPNKHEFECILSLNDSMMTVVLFSVLKALKSNFVIYCTSRQVIVALFDHFFFIAVLSWYYMFTFPHLSKALGHDWSLILRNIVMNWHINWIRWQIFEISNSSLDILNVQSQTDMMDSRETVYIISVEMLWYDNCAINIILYWPVHYKRASEFELHHFQDVIFFDVYSVFSYLWGGELATFTNIYCMYCHHVKVLCFCFDIVLND